MKRLIGLIIYLVFTVAQSQPLDTLLQQADRGNPGLKARLEEFEASLQRVPQASSLADPTLTVAAFGQMVETRVGQQVARISLSQMFPWFGTLAAQKDAASINAKVVFQSYLDERNRLHFEVRKNYFRLAESESVLHTLEETIDVLSTLKTFATQKFQNGQTSMADVLRIDLMTNEVRNNIQVETLRRESLITTLNLLLDRDIETVITVDSLTEIGSDSFSLDSIQTSNPKLAALRYRKQSAEALEQVAIKQGMPKIGVGFEYIITEKRPVNIEDNGKDAYMPMVTLSLPIYRKKYRASVEETRHMQKSYEAMELNTRNELASAYTTALLDHEKAEDEKELYDMQTRQTEQILELLRTDFSNSGKGIEDILNAQLQLLKYKISGIRSHGSSNVAQAQLMYIVAK